MRIIVLLCLSALAAQAQKPELVLPTIHSNPISEVRFSADNRFMVTCAGSELKLWEQKTGRLLKTIPTPLPVSDIAVSKDGTKLAVGTYCGASEYLEDQGSVPDINTEVQVWDMVSGKMLRKLKVLGKPIRINEVEISENGQLVLAHFDGNITCWDANSGAEKFKIPEECRWPKLRFSSDGSHFLLDSETALYWVYSQTGVKEIILEQGSIALSSQGDEVLALTPNGILKRWNGRSKTFSPEIKPELEDFEREPISIGIFDFQTTDKLWGPFIGVKQTCISIR